ncbi:MAG: DIP1984 family protein [Trichodesmium sp. MO_231.B1]|nr:DIP1984 family protein [Trichodesmium sp. MO_231.B1]
MKLAEALILRTDCQKRIEQLKARLIRSATVQEGEQPAEDPQTLIGELDTTLNQLSELIKKINNTNSQTILTGEITISDALAEKDIFMLKRNIYSDIVTESAEQSYRYRRS